VGLGCREAASGFLLRSFYFGGCDLGWCDILWWCGGTGVWLAPGYWWWGLCDGVVVVIYGGIEIPLLLFCGGSHGGEWVGIIGEWLFVFVLCFILIIL